MFLASEHLSFAAQFAIVVVPVALYFLVLGLLNTRRSPQMLSGRQDFLLLLTALSPLLVLPALGLTGVRAESLLLVAGGLAGATVFLAPRGRHWVIYNLSLGEARRLLTDALADAGLSGCSVSGGFELEGGGSVELTGFPLLRNVTIRLRCPAGRGEAIERALAARVGRVEAETNPLAVGMLLVATGMMVIPLALVADRVPELVRIVTDLLP